MPNYAYPATESDPLRRWQLAPKAAPVERRDTAEPQPQPQIDWPAINKQIEAHILKFGEANAADLGNTFQSFRDRCLALEGLFKTELAALRNELSETRGRLTGELRGRLGAVEPRMTEVERDVRDRVDALERRLGEAERRMTDAATEFRDVLGDDVKRAAEEHRRLTALGINVR